MRRRHARVERFKRFDAPGIDIDFQNKATGEIADRFLILGDNASGKTTLLQAIALTLSLAHVTRESAQVMVGWRWRRKEIENYVIEPELLARVLRWTDTQKQEYSTKLDDILDALAHVTAARIALTSCAAKRNRIETNVPFSTDAATMKAELRQKSQRFNQTACIDEQGLLDIFDCILPECLPGGKFRSSALDVFAGKNILAKMQQTSGMPPATKSREKLFELVLDALEKDRDSHTWLAEWDAIRDAVQNWMPSM